MYTKINILRKEEKCIPEIVQTMRDKGSVSSTLRVRVACHGGSSCYNE